MGIAQRHILTMIAKSGYWNEMSDWHYDSAHQTNHILTTLSERGWVKRTDSRAKYGHFEITDAGAEKVASLEAERAEAARLIANAKGSTTDRAKASMIYKAISR